MRDLQNPRFIERFMRSVILAEMSTRFSTLAAALILSLPAMAGPDARPGQSAGAPAAAAPAAPSGDAAAKHAKRTMCLNSAKIKKLVGAEKASFLKACIAAP